MKDISVYLIAVAIIILAVQIVTEIVKSIFKTIDNKSYNIIVVAISLVLTVITVIAAAQITGFTLTWYIIVGAVVGAFFVAYGAMYGYDKLIKRIFDAIKNAKGIDSKEE